MKSFVIARLLMATQANNPLGLDICTADGGCADFRDDDGNQKYVGGCCNQWEAVEFGDEATLPLGNIGQNFMTYTGTDTPTPGTSFSACMPKPYIDGSADAYENGTTNYDDLVLFLGILGVAADTAAAD